MPTLALPPQPSPAFVTHAGEWNEHASQGNGHEAVRLFDLANEVLTHWLQRAEVLVTTLQEADDYSYLSVPANRVFYVKTRYVYGGKGQPRPFDLDDE